MNSCQYLALIMGVIPTLLQTATASPISANSSLTWRADTPAIVPDYTTAEAGNPFIQGWYATPDIAFHEGRYWVFVAPSPDADRCFQYYFDAFSSPDLIHWTKHDKVLSRKGFHRPGTFHYARCALRRPTSVARDGKYYLYFSAGEPEHEPAGGIAVAVADRPEGPYRDATGQALLTPGHGDVGGDVRPTDPSVLVDDDGQAYLYYGGTAPRYDDPRLGPRAAVARLNRDMVSLGDFGEVEVDRRLEFALVTPSEYGGGVRVFKRRGRYYMLWNEGRWDDDGFRVAYGVSGSPTGPWRRSGVILHKDDAVATGTGDVGVVNVPGTDIWYVVYNRRQLGAFTTYYSADAPPDIFRRERVPAWARTVALDRLHFEPDGSIRPVQMLVKDNFADGNADNWALYNDARFAVEGGELRGTKGIAAVNSKFFDLEQEADVRLLATSAPNGNAGLVFRLRPHPWEGAEAGPDGYDGYYAGVSAEGGGKVVLGVATQKTWRPLGEARFPVELGRAYRLRVRAWAGRVEVYVDDMAAPRVVATCGGPDDPGGDAHPRQPFCRWHVSLGAWWDAGGGDQKLGMSGVRVFEATAAFDNFSVRGL